MDSLANQLAAKGYLTANGFVAYLHEVCPSKAVSYPTMQRMLKTGKVESFTVGNQRRISKEEIERYLREGNREEGQEPSSSVFRLGQEPSYNRIKDDTNDD